MKISRLLKAKTSTELLKGAVRRITRLTGLTPEAANAQLLATLDLPAEQEVCQWYIHVCGWAFSRTGEIAKLEATLDGIDLGPIQHGVQRIDVQQAYPELPTDRCGFSELFVPPIGIQSNAAEHKLVLRVTDTGGNTREFTRHIRLQKAVEKLIPSQELAALPQPVFDEAHPPVPNSNVSVIIPTLNAGEEFTSLLTSLRSQLGIERLEIIVVDSGSSDRTMMLAEEFGALVHTIRPEEFSHSSARNIGADLAAGTYLMFMTQDAMPGSLTWLAEILYALQNNDAVAATCLESPRSDTDLFYQANNWAHRRFLQVDAGDRILTMPQSKDYKSLRQNSQLCNIACVIDRQTFHQYRFRYDYGEDLELGLRLIRDGKRLLLLDSAPVIHSHHRNAYYYLRRGYVDTIWLSRMFPDYPLQPSLRFEDLCRQMVDSYHLLSRCARAFKEMQFPCTATEFLSEAKSQLDKLASAQLQPAALESDPYSAFLSTVVQAASMMPASPGDHSNQLLNAVKEALQPFWLYFSQTFEVIDQAIACEVEQSMYKMHGMISGGFWASHFLQNATPGNGIALQIKNEIGRGV
jgi:glycosyltransferase involved in cell wall biosynthesis